MEPSQIVIIAIAGIVVQYLIIRIAVAHGNNSDFKDKQLAKQTNLLAEMARKQGIEEEQIQMCLKA
jgi:hypothetical protein